MSLQRTLSAEKPKLFLMSYLAKEKQLRAMAEEKRVLYVAMTRCKDHLVLSASQGGTREADSFFGWIQPRLGDLPVQRRAPQLSSSVAIGDGGKPDGSTVVQLHNGAFEKKTAQLLKLLQPQDNASLGNLKFRRDSTRPFSPAAPPACSRSLALEALLALNFPDEATDGYLRFRNAFEAAARQLPQGVEAALQCISSSAWPCEDENERSLITDLLRKSFRALLAAPEVAEWQVGSAMTVRMQELVLRCRADLQVTDSLLPVHYFVVPAESFRHRVSVLAGWHAQLYQVAGLATEVGIFDVVQNSAELVSREAVAPASAVFRSLAAEYSVALERDEGWELERLLR
jgi:hypothetical protein